MSYRELFEVGPRCVRLTEVDSTFTGRVVSKAAATAAMERDDRRLDKLQYLLYAQHARSLLIVLQGMDAAGKDGTIRHVFQALNPARRAGTRLQDPFPGRGESRFSLANSRSRPPKG